MAILLTLRKGSGIVHPRMICENGTSNLKSSRTGPSSCQCSTTLTGQKREKAEIYISNAENVKDYTKRFLQGHWTCLGPGSEKKWYGGSSYPPKGERDSTANEMVQRFKETGHPVFKSISALSRGTLKQKRKTSIHFNGDSMNTDRALVPNSSLCQSVFTVRQNQKMDW